MALIEIDALPNLKNGWIFPWQTVNVITRWYPLVNVYITMENHHFNGKTHYRWAIFNSYVSHNQMVGGSQWPQRLVPGEPCAAPPTDHWRIPGDEVPGARPMETIGEISVEHSWAIGKWWKMSQKPNKHENFHAIFRADDSEVDAHH